MPVERVLLIGQLSVQRGILFQMEKVAQATRGVVPTIGEVVPKMNSQSPSPHRWNNFSHLWNKIPSRTLNWPINEARSTVHSQTAHVQLSSRSIGHAQQARSE